MKPTSEDFKPRRDGWFEHRGVWDEVTVGTVIASHQSRAQRWEIIAQAHGQQVEYGQTLWMRAREQVSGEEISVAPRPKVAGVVILTQDPSDTQTPPVTAPSDSDAIMQLVTQLGAVHLATRDNVTGEIVCPDYSNGDSHLPSVLNGELRRAVLEHLSFAHGFDVSTLRDTGIKEIIVAHGRSHNPKHPEIGKGGFPHRHVPEDPNLL